MAKRRAWKCGNHYAAIQAVEQISDERSGRALRSEFGVAQKFHANFYHGFREEGELASSRAISIEFVGRMLVPVDGEQE